MMRLTLSGYIILSVLLFSCTKRTIRVPTACLKSDKTHISVNDTITFTNCSSAESVVLIFPKRGEEEKGVHMGYSFDAQNMVSKQFTDTGDFTAVLRAYGDAGAPIVTAMIYLRVD